MERYRKFLLLVVCAFVALSAKAPVGAAGAGVDTATLKKITSRLDARTGVLAIEASDPVPYVASQPDPKTFVIELRYVVAAPVSHPVQADPRNPFADYSAVYVPYCTGDVHIGSVTTEYADGLTIQHKGYANGPLSFLWASSESGERGAALLHVPVRERE